MPRIWRWRALGLSHPQRSDSRSQESIKGLRAMLAAIRKRGYSVSNQAREIGVSSVAAAFCDRAGLLIGTVSIAMPTDRADPVLIARLGQLVAAAAAQIEHRLFGRELPNSLKLPICPETRP